MSEERSTPARGESSNPRELDERAERDRFPAGIPYIVGNEGAERFSYYGMRAILYVYLAALFVRFRDNVPDVVADEAAARSTQITHLFFAGVYLFPLIGAILADRLLGKYNVIFWVSLVYCAGHAVLAVAGHMGTIAEFGTAEMCMYLGLALIAVGSGGIKPCVSANVGDQFTERNSHLVTRVFQIFYFIINFGSFFSTLITPYLYANVGPEVAFGVPGVLMFLATLIFWLGRKKFVRVPPNPGGWLGLLDTVTTVLLFSPIFALIVGYFMMFEHFEAPEGVAWHGYLWALVRYYAVLLGITAGAFSLGFYLFTVRQKIREDTGFLAVLVYAFRQRKHRQPGERFFDGARAHFGEEAGDGPPAVLKIMLVFSMVSMFWALFDQHGSTWIAQAGRMDLAISIPRLTGMWIVVTVVCLAIYGGAWLMLRVSNVLISRKLTFAVVAALALLGAAAGVWDLVEQKRTDIVLEPAQLSALNPLMVMLIIPLLNIAVWGPLQRMGVTVRPLVKMSIGMFLAAIAFAGAAALQLRIEAAGDGQVHGLWQAGPYLIMTTAEVLISVTGLEFAYTQAPRAMKSTIMGFWLLCVTFGNLIVAFLAPLQKTLELSEFFFVFAGLMAGAAVIFSLLATLYRGKTYLQSG